MPSLNKYLLIGAIALFLLMGVGLYWQHSTISSQRDTMALQREALERFESDRAAQAKADESLKSSRERIAKERDRYKRELQDALENNVCANTALPPDAKRMLEDLYNSKGS